MPRPGAAPHPEGPSVPPLAELHAALDHHVACPPPRSEIGRAIAHVPAGREGPTCRAEDGRVDMASNAVENVIRPSTLQTALFAGHDEGGRSWARLASPAGTCGLNDVERHARLTAALEALARGHPTGRIDALMPWAFDGATALPRPHTPKAPTQPGSAPPVWAARRGWHDPGGVLPVTISEQRCRSRALGALDGAGRGHDVHRTSEAMSRQVSAVRVGLGVAPVPASVAAAEP